MRTETESPMFESIESIRNAGFLDFFTVDELREGRLRQVPEEAGVYLVLRTEATPPVFLEVSPAGHFKGRNPTMPVSKLRANWITGTPVLYIGKAGGPKSDATLRSRLDQYLKFGAGRPVGHRGGKYIWQVKRSGSFIVCWKPTPNQAPREVERKLIVQFKAEYDGRRPFANQRD